MKKNKLFAAIFAFIISVLVLMFVPFLQVLVVKQFNGSDKSKKYFSHYAAKNGFVINYRHSVNKGLVSDFYRTGKNGSLFLYETHFVNYGAGISEPDEIPGAEFKVLSSGAYALTSLNRELDQLVMAVGVVANHSIEIAEQEFFLTEYFESQTRLLIFVKRVSLFEYLFSSSRF